MFSKYSNFTIKSSKKNKKKQKETKNEIKQCYAKKRKRHQNCFCRRINFLNREKQQFFIIYNQIKHTIMYHNNALNFIICEKYLNFVFSIFNIIIIFFVWKFVKNFIVFIFRFHFFVFFNSFSTYRSTILLFLSTIINSLFSIFFWKNKMIFFSNAFREFVIFLTNVLNDFRIFEFFVVFNFYNHRNTKHVEQHNRKKIC